MVASAQGIFARFESNDDAPPGSPAPSDVDGLPWRRRLNADPLRDYGQYAFGQPSVSQCFTARFRCVACWWQSADAVQRGRCQRPRLFLPVEAIASPETRLTVMAGPGTRTQPAEQMTDELAEPLAFRSRWAAALLIVVAQLPSWTQGLIEA